MFTSIRWRIAMAYVGLIVVAMLALSVSLLQSLRQDYLRRLEEQLVAQARLVANSAAPQVLAGDPRMLDDLVQRFRADSGARITLIARDGRVIAESDEDAALMENHGSTPEVVQALAAGVGGSTRPSATVGYDMMYAAVPILSSDETLGVARVALPVTAIDRSMWQIAQTMLLATVATGLLAIVLAVWIARRTTQPVKRLAQFAQAIAGGEFNRRVEVTSRDEVGELGQAFNRMAAQLDETITALTRERNEADAILAHMTDGIVIAGQDGRVRLINPAAGRLLQLTPGDHRQRTLAEVLRHHDLVELARQCLSNGQGDAAAPLETELTVGQRRVRVVASRIGSPGMPVQGAMLVLRDVTEQHRVDALRRDFVANVSHELRTPIASLQALVETLESGALEDPPAARYFLERMHVEVAGLAQLVQELLELSRIESGSMRLRLETAELEPLVFGTAERLRPLAERQGIALAIDTPTRSRVAVDRELLQQAVLNLVHNAIKFTQPGGQVTVTTRQRDGDIVIGIADTGVGIAPQDLDRVFERFYKVDRSRASGGSGLGLAIAKHVAQAHGGRIWAESEGLGRGAAFSLALPLPSALASGQPDDGRTGHAQQKLPDRV